MPTTNNIDNTSINSVISIAKLKPQVVKFWDTKRNGITAYNEPSDSAIEREFSCPVCHEVWTDTALNISKAKYVSCPYCPFQYNTLLENNLLTDYPDIMNTWDIEENHWTPDQYSLTSLKLAHFKCERGHKYVRPIHIEVKRKSSCPKCYGRNFEPGVKDLLHKFPEIAAEWDHELNGDLTPDMVSYGSKKRVHWKCKKGHKWVTAVYDRTSAHTNCPHCKASSTSFPEQFLYWGLKELWSDTENRYKSKDGYEYDIFIPSINFALEYSGAYWHNNKNEYDDLKKKSAEYNGTAFLEVIGDYRYKDEDYFSPNLIKYNPGRDKKQDTLKRVISMIAIVYGKDTKLINYSRVRLNATEHSKGRIEESKSLAAKYPEIAAEWDYEASENLGVIPSEILSNSNKKFRWRCKHGHTWISTVINRTINKSGCPDCWAIRRGGSIGLGHTQ